MHLLLFVSNIQLLTTENLVALDTEHQSNMYPEELPKEDSLPPH